MQKTLSPTTRRVFCLCVQLRVRLRAFVILNRMLRLILPLFVTLFLWVPNTHAATLYIDPASSTISRGDAITAAVRLMPNKDEGECINVVDAVINYSENIQPTDVSIGKSIFSIWVERPVIDKERRQITFAGGIPNGYCGRVDGDPMLTNILAEIIFRSPGMQVGSTDSGDQAIIEFSNETQALLNDGQGTVASLTTLGSTITLEKTAGPTIVDEWHNIVAADNIPPEKFSINLNRDENGINFNGRYFIDFITTDKQTGIDHYEIMEEPISRLNSFTWGAANVPWTDVTSPYVLKDQSLNIVIRVKAVDKAGNEYIATLVPDQSLKTISQDQVITYLVLGGLGLIFIILIIFIIIWRKRRKSALVNIEEVINEDKI